MLTFIINLYCPKVCYRPDHSIRIVGYHRKNIIIPKPDIFTETRMQDFFFVTSVNVISSSIQTILFFAPFLYSCIMLRFRATETIFAGNQTQDSFSAYWPLCLLLSRLVSELHKTSRIELRTVFLSSDPPMFTSWSQGIRMLNLVQIGTSVLEL
jgi:hypothetical protein